MTLKEQQWCSQWFWEYLPVSPAQARWQMMHHGFVESPALPHYPGPALSDYYLPSVQASLMICFPGACNWCPALPIRNIKRKGAIACQYSFGIRFYSFIHILYLHAYVHFMSKNQLSDQHISIFLRKRGWWLRMLSNSLRKLCTIQ